MQTLWLLWICVWKFLRKLKIESPYDLSLPLLGTYPKESKSANYRNTSTSIFVSALFTAAKRGNQPRCHKQKKRVFLYIFNIHCIHIDNIYIVNIHAIHIYCVYIYNEFCLVIKKVKLCHFQMNRSGYYYVKKNKVWVVVVHTYNASTREEEAVQSLRVEGQPAVQSEFKPSLKKGKWKKSPN